MRLPEGIGENKARAVARVEQIVGKLRNPSDDRLVRSRASGRAATGNGVFAAGMMSNRDCDVDVRCWSSGRLHLMKTRRDGHILATTAFAAFAIVALAVAAFFTSIRADPSADEQLPNGSRKRFVLARIFVAILVTMLAGFR